MVRHVIVYPVLEGPDPYETINFKVILQLYFNGTCIEYMHNDKHGIEKVYIEDFILPEKSDFKVKLLIHRDNVTLSEFTPDNIKESVSIKSKYEIVEVPVFIARYPSEDKYKLTVHLTREYFKG